MARAEQPLGPEHFINRELSWLEFNQRVLDEAIHPETPLLERLKFFCITSSNLDEFFEVRVAGVKQQIESEVVERSVDGLTATEAFRAMARRVRQMVDLQYTLWRTQLAPALARNGIRILKVNHLKGPDRQWVDNYYQSEVLPVLTPLAIDPAHPFPQLLNKSLNIILQLEKKEGKKVLRYQAVVQVPRNLPRLIQLPRENGRMDFVLLGDLIGSRLEDLFVGTTIRGHWLFRVTRNSELYVDEEDSANLLKAVETELHNRRKGEAVRLEVEKGCPHVVLGALRNTLRLAEDDVYVIDGPLAPQGLMKAYQGDHSPELRDAPFVAPVAPALEHRDDLFAAIRERDILLHHPYESFNSVVGFLEQAAADPRVLAIKQTLYRTGGDLRIIGALMNAVKKGKQVTAVVELRARFDEANNIQWARHLEENGVHVVYGLVGYKIHAKASLVVRRDDDGIRRYVHLGTGNYNPSTARLYTDLGLLTCKSEFGEDVTNLFNLLTGICQYQGSHKLLVAPFDLQKRILEHIEREIAHARQGLPSRIMAKLNSLVDPVVIAALYRASQAGVRIDLIVRGTCCLRPGWPGVSENITVRSIVDRFLEHPRIFYFENAARPQVYLSSADWMPRNFYRRIETAFPIEDGVLRERVINEILAISFSDNVKARRLKPDGLYHLPKPGPGEAARRSQSEFMALALERSADRKRKVPTEPALKRLQVLTQPPLTGVK
ncbi:MAG: polyphosphate kinase 1 [Verrucomicrobia bacterium]|nr:polyphosphate kinase 1 [Verrucomicrobiota bacterium]